MLKLTNIHAGYTDTPVLKGVDIEIDSGKIVALIGPNGAGKSTILRSIFGLADVTLGRINFIDKDITKLETYELIKLGISFVPQGRQVFPSMTVLENLYMGAYTIKDKDVIQQNIKDVFKAFPDLEKKRGDNASTLSGGQQQILAIGRALIQSPRVLLMDEPSLGLSPKVTHEIFDKIGEIKDNGVAILLVEQNAYQAVSIADKTYILESGEVVLSGGKDILQNKNVEEVYFGGQVQ